MKGKGGGWWREKKKKMRGKFYNFPFLVNDNVAITQSIFVTAELMGLNKVKLKGNERKMEDKIKVRGKSFK